MSGTEETLLEAAKRILPKGFKIVRDICESQQWGSGLPAYKCNHHIPGAPAGTIFVLASSQQVGKISRTEWLANAWVDGNCQSMGGHSWVSGVIIFPDTVLEQGQGWFTRIYNCGKYTI